MFLVAPVSLLIILPLVGAVVIAALPERRLRAGPWIAFGVALFTLIVTLALGARLPERFAAGDAWALVGEVNRPWIAAGT